MTAASARRLVVFGPGYCGAAIAAAARAAGWAVDTAGRGETAELRAATHVLTTVAPDDTADPVLARFGPALAAAPALRWAGYLSTTGVYGDRAGATVDETTPPAPSSERTARRVAAEQAWTATLPGAAVDIFRLAGIYGPGRSAFDDLRAGRARRIDRPGQVFNRIHRDDIVAAVLAAMGQYRAPGPRVLNLADDEPAEPRAVIEEAARLLGAPVPPLVPFETAWASMSPMARSFWGERRVVRAERTKEALGIAWRHPTYREGLRAILAENLGQHTG